MHAAVGSAGGWLGQAAKRMTVWDSVFFTRVAQCGYEYEHFHAFFPLLPGLLRLAQVSVTQPEGWAEVCGLLLSNIAFVASALLFCRLSSGVLQNERLTRMATLLYIFNPASVFHSALYTESIFGLATFAAMHYAQRHHMLAAASLFALSSAARSNGVLGCWFIIHPTLVGLGRCGRTARKVVRSLLCMMGYSCLIAAPLIAFQYHGYTTFCGGLRGDSSLLPSWCNTRLPYLYGYIQANYWGVGFFRYYQLKQLPNFFLAAPVLFLPKSGYLADDVAVYVYHWALMSAVVIFLMHIQVATRFLSCCPPLFWYAAHLYSIQGGQWIWAFWLSYVALGAVLFPNFYPWT
ncbi:hypothetical protein WJX72_005101 [[Myrmecia] bisecta]|uniref:GPI mannosyltransferase 2 n=1 Tax=[Myrmecia] bisecta TaxID=41462 RepID=A0AAW1P899_9CHLO